MAATLAPALIGTATGFLVRHFGDDQIEDMLGQGDVTCGPGTILKDNKCMNFNANVMSTQCFFLDTASCEISKFCKQTDSLCDLQDEFKNAEAIEFQHQMFCNEFDKTDCPLQTATGPAMCKVDGEKCVPDATTFQQMGA